MKTTTKELRKPIRNYALAAYIIGVTTILATYSLTISFTTI
jgi:hypothetical protein